MADEFKLFTSEVKSSYELKMANGNMPPGLERLSSARIVNYLVPRLGSNELKNDLQTLERIFNPAGVYPTLKNAIEDFHKQEKFKTLGYFIKGKTISPDENIIKLLAILIDFQPRPFNKWKAERLVITNENVEGTGENSPLEEGIEDQQTNGFVNNGNTSGEEGHLDLGEVLPSEGDDTGIGKVPTTIDKEKADVGKGKIDEPVVTRAALSQPPVPSTEKKWAWSTIKKPFTYVSSIAVLCLSSYFVTKTFDRQCMYWAGDRYVQVACNDTSIDAVKIALDEQLLTSLKRITQPDTLKKSSVGKVWYVKINIDSVEFYTAPGFYPLDRDKVLKPITEYIVDKYVLNKRIHQFQ